MKNYSKNIENTLKDQWVEGGIDRGYSQKYNVGVPYTRARKSILPGLVLAASLTLAALIGSCEEPNTNSTYAHQDNIGSTSYK